MLKLIISTKGFLVSALAIVIVMVLAAGIAAQAAVPAVSFEAEAGSLSGQVMVTNSGSVASSASGGAFIDFGGSTNPPGTVTLPNPGTWTNVTGNLANIQSECGNLSFLSAVPNSNKVIAGIAARGLWQSTGGSWSQLGTGSGSATITNRTSQISYDPNNPQIFWESGIYNGGGVYKTTNGGQTFQQLGTIGHNDFVSVDFSDPNRQTLLAGGHEQTRTLYKSTNGGQTWTSIGSSLPSGTGFSSAPVVINSQTYIINVQASWSGGSSGIYRTTNGGSSWTRVSTEETTRIPLVTSGGAIYYARGSYAVDGLIRSTDNGQTWTVVGAGTNSAPIELPDGRLAAVRGNRLAVSSDQGQTWTNFGANLPYSPAVIAYSSGQSAFFVSNWDCGNVVLSNGIMKLQ